MTPSLKQTIAAVSSFILLSVTGTHAASCVVEGWMDDGDYAVSGAVSVSQLNMYQDGNKIATYSGDYDPNCCINKPRTTNFDSPLPYVFEYTATVDTSGTSLKGCSGNYGDQIGLVGVVDSSTDNFVVGSDIGSTCSISFDC